MLVMFVVFVWKGKENSCAKLYGCVYLPLEACESFSVEFTSSEARLICAPKSLKLLFTNGEQHHDLIVYEAVRISVMDIYYNTSPKLPTFPHGKLTELSQLRCYSLVKIFSNIQNNRILIKCARF